MLLPQSNKYRSQWCCPPLWKFKTDPDQRGEQEGWFNGFESSIEIAVPGSWNEQLEEIGLLNYVGSAWYHCELFLPQEPGDRLYWLRVGSADYRAKVWLNGKFVGEHDGAFVPFEFNVTDSVRTGERNAITILVNNQLSADTIPQGIRAEDYEREDRLREETFPPARFDYFPFGGIHRPVLIHSTPRSFISSVFVDTFVEGARAAKMRVRLAATEGNGMVVRCAASDAATTVSAQSPVSNGGTVVEGHLKHCHLWSPDDPHLYALTLQLIAGDRIVDEYEMQVGFRQVAIVNGKLHLNGKPVYLKGFGRHEDFPVLGRGHGAPLLVKDFGLMKWINANSFRTSHYPYCEETMAMADRQGMLVIDEVPAVSLDMRATSPATLATHKRAVTELILRDYNHPSVIIWALGNEPNLVGENGYNQGSGKEYWREVFACARSLDSSRPMTVPNCGRAGVADPVFEFSDIASINRYYGWYEYPGRIDHAMCQLEKEIEAIYKRYGKPLMMTEFGADTIPGLHSISDQMFTEEYQEKLLDRYIRLLRSKDYVIGEHVWNFADFRTPQHFRRVVLNMKGIFTRTRQPKAAAFALKKLWASPVLPD